MKMILKITISEGMTYDIPLAEIKAVLAKIEEGDEE